MKSTVFEFNSDSYFKEEVDNFSREICDVLKNHDEDNVIAYPINNPMDLVRLLNGTSEVNHMYFYRVFVEEN